MEPYEPIRDEDRERLVDPDRLACGKRADQACGEDGEFHKARCYNDRKLFTVYDKSDPVHADSQGQRGPYSPNGHHRYCQCGECYARYGP